MFPPRDANSRDFGGGGNRTRVLGTPDSRAKQHLRSRPAAVASFPQGARLLLVALAVLVVLPDGRAETPPHRIIAAGVYHACAADSRGAVVCWGWNEQGQLGNGTTADAAHPVAVAGLPPVTGLSANYNTSCALAGSVYCWGRNDAGQLGDGSTVNRSMPVAVQGLPGGVSVVSIAKSHACALASGRVWCWGANDAGQLGRGTVGETGPPAVVPGLVGVSQVVTGKDFTCALARGGLVWCWGRNSEGQLGTGMTTPSAAPTVVHGLRGVAMIAATGDFACALTRRSAVYCWGENDHGQTGDGRTANRTTPGLVRGAGGALVALVAGPNHACTLGRAGTVRCWGRNDHGELGDGTTVERRRPVAVRGLGRGVIALSSSGHYVLALTGSGQVWAWGRNQHGQLGDGGTVDRPLPFRVVSLR